jgi:quercetin dioxygenase-like cupin family protein
MPRDPSGPGPPVAPVGDVLIRGSAYAMAERRLAPGDGAALQRHDHDEALYVLAGVLRAEVDGELLEAGPNRAVFVPAGTRHALVNDGPTDVVLLSICAPPPVGEEPGGRTVRDEAARAVDAPPGRVRVLVRGSDGSGRLAVVDSTIEPGHAGPLLHHHPFDEAFYVLEGTLIFQLDEERLVRTAGEAVHAAGGVPHTFANHGGTDARMLIVCSPAGFERYFDRLAAAEHGDAAPPPEAIDRYPEITVVGPRIGRR